MKNKNSFTKRDTYGIILLLLISFLTITVHKCKSQEIDIRNVDRTFITYNPIKQGIGVIHIQQIKNFIIAPMISYEYGVYKSLYERYYLHKTSFGLSFKRHLGTLNALICYNKTNSIKLKNPSFELGFSSNISQLLAAMIMYDINNHEARIGIGIKY